MRFLLVKTICYLATLALALGCQSGNEQVDAKVFDEKYSGIVLIDSLTGDSIKCYLRINEDKVYSLKESSRELEDCRMERVFFDFELDIGESRKPNYTLYGKNDICIQMRPIFNKRGYILTLLNKEENYFFFKHTVVDSTLGSIEYTDLSKLHSENQSPIISERYYVVIRVNGEFKILHYKELGGDFNFKFDY